MASKTIGESTDARSQEYVTYAPPGARCALCGKQVASLERVRRVMQDFGSGSARSAYVHYEACVK